MLDIAIITELEKHFHKNELPISLQELQGIIFGYLCTQKEPCFQSWVAACDDLLNWSTLNTESKEQIKQLFLSAHMELQQELPLSIVLNSAKTSANTISWELVEWVRGFLYGLGLSQSPPNFYTTPEIAHILKELTALTQLDLNESLPLNAQEKQAYNDIVADLQNTIFIIFDKIRSYE
jgi:uncharacterized protein YgfB (UPF0149 family)